MHYVGGSDHLKRAADHFLQALPTLLAPLPVEKLASKGLRTTLSHLQGSLRMGASRADSVVDGSLIHHDVRNLVVVGTSVLPTCPPVEPSLTAAALSLRSADLVMGGRS